MRVDARVPAAASRAGELRRLARVGDGVSLDGAAPRSEVQVAPRPGALLEVDGRLYPGTLLVRAAAAGGLEARNRTDLESYIEGVVAAESVLWSAQRAELEAQAIVARSYALAQHRARGARQLQVWDDTRDQVYGGLFRPEPGDHAQLRRAAAELSAAVAATRGVVLFEGASIVDARFHAACGGHTTDVAGVFPEAAQFRCMRAVACAPCTRDDSVAGTWRFTAPPETLARVARSLGVGDRVTRLRALERDASGRWLTVEVHGSAGVRDASFASLRREIGAEQLESGALVSLWPHEGEPIRAGLAFVGRGRGHGVGLCQAGARQYAASGWSAERILSHYYPGSVLAPAKSGPRP